MKPLELLGREVGSGLLHPEWGKDRKSVTENLAMAYSQVVQEGAVNYVLWKDTTHQTISSLKEHLKRDGLSSPALYNDDLRDSIELPVPGRDPNGHIQYVRALLTDYQDRFCEHIRTRMQTDGNVHLEITGPTGMGKSSCAIALANWIKPITPQNLIDHLSIDLTELPRKLQDKTVGDTVIQDEYVQGAGEGASTVRNLFANLEDTLRGSQVNLFVLSPRDQEHGTMQAKLELLLWNRERMFSLFMVWHNDRPRGVVAIPWAPPELWQVYGPWKRQNVERTLRSQFRDPAYKAKKAMQAFENPKVVQYLTLGVSKPKLKHFYTALVDFEAQMLSGDQAKGIAAFMHDRCYDYDRTQQAFNDLFGVPVNPGFEEVAKRCYEE